MHTYMYVSGNVYSTDLYVSISGIQSIPGSASKKPETFTMEPSTGNMKRIQQPETESRQPLNHLQGTRKWIQATRNLPRAPLNHIQGTKSRNLHQAMMEPSPGGQEVNPGNLEPSQGNDGSKSREWVTLIRQPWNQVQGTQNEIQATRNLNQATMGRNQRK